MRRVIFSLAVLGLIVLPISSAVAQNRVGEGINAAANAPGKAVQGTGQVITKGGEAVPVVGKPVEVTGKVVTTTGKVVEGVTDSATGAPISRDAKAMLAAPVNCSTATADVAALENEHRSTLNRLQNGVGSVLPISAAVRLLGGNYVNGAKVATGKYNRDLEAKVKEIRKTCNL